MSYADRFPAVISLGRVRSDLIGTVITGDPPHMESNAQRCLYTCSLSW